VGNVSDEADKIRNEMFEAIERDMLRKIDFPDRFMGMLRVFVDKDAYVNDIENGLEAG
jgi:hypothetical protein